LGGAAQLVLEYPDAAPRRLGHAVHQPQETRAQKHSVIGWVRKDYLRLREEHPNIAEPWIGGSFTYDAVSNLVIKAYSSRLGKVPDQEALLVH